MTFSRKQPKRRKGSRSMEITQKNVQIAKDILKIMNEQQCTVAEANDILAFVRNQIYTTTTVQATISTNLSV